MSVSPHFFLKKKLHLHPTRRCALRWASLTSKQPNSEARPAFLYFETDKTRLRYSPSIYSQEQNGRTYGYVGREMNIYQKWYGNTKIQTNLAVVNEHYTEPSPSADQPDYIHRRVLPPPPPPILN
jgi:hypothetical protein